MPATTAMCEVLKIQEVRGPRGGALYVHHLACGAWTTQRHAVLRSPMACIPCTVRPQVEQVDAVRAAFARGAREGWMRAAVFYQDLAAEDDPAVVAEMERRWPL